MDRDFHVGEWLVEPDLNTVSRNGEAVHLQPKVMKVLVCLAEHSGQSVSKEELLNSVWANTFVGDDVLKRSISELRRVFEDDVQAPSFIQTIPKCGYRLVAPVYAASVHGKPPAAQDNRSSRAALSIKHLLAIAIASFLLILVGADVLPRSKESSSTQSGFIRIRSLAVLPLENLSADPEPAYFSDGMTDGLITDLAQMGSLKIISRTSSMQYRQTRKSLPEIARELRVDGIVEGTVQHSGNRVRITAQLIEASTDHHLWANTYEGELGDTFELEKHVAEDIADQVLVRVAARNQSPSSSRIIDPRALEEYLQGSYNLNRFSRGSGDEELKLAADHFLRATEIDQNFALAYVGLANAHRSTIQSSNDDRQIATQSAHRALELDPNLSEAWVSLGDLKEGARNWDEALTDFRRAVALNPNNAWAHECLADILDIMGKPEEVWKEYEIAQELDPIQDHLSYAFFKRRKYDQAIQEVLRHLGNDPNDGYAHSKLFEEYSAKGLHKEAVKELQQTARLFGHPDVAATLGNAYAASGYMGAMREYAKALEHLHATKQAFIPINIAAAYTVMGNKDRAFYWLEQGYQQKGYRSGGVDFEQVGVYPPLDPLHSDPRFTNLLRRMGLPTARIDGSDVSQEKTAKASVNP